MTDGIIKGNGDSRYLKSVVDFLSRYPNYEAFAQALIAGTLPIDLNGINTSGWTQVGTSLNKATLFSDQAASNLGLSSTKTPSDGFIKLKQLIDTANSNISPKAKVISGSYVGTGSGGRDNPNSIAYSSTPYAIVIWGKGKGSELTSIVLVYGCTECTSGGLPNYSPFSFAKVTWSSNKVTWYGFDNAEQGNLSGETYRYLILTK